MARHLQTEIEKLKQRLLALCATVEKNVAVATRAIWEQDESRVAEVMGTDHRIDREEVEVEEECLKILALHQPVAVDLRMIIAILKINNDLERIGDLAVNIAERARFLQTQKLPPEGFEFEEMVDKVMRMLRWSVDALVSLDVDLAYRVCAVDDEVDAMNKKSYEVFGRLTETGNADPRVLTHLLSVSRHLERIADHATNIAEDVIYMITGDIVRHKMEDYLG